jgi:hypothetical protein
MAVERAVVRVAHLDCRQVPAWMTDPYGYVLSLALVVVLLVAQTMGWAGKGARVVAQASGLKARVVSGMEQTKAGRRWLRHPWLTGAGMLLLAVVFGAIFNTVGRR